jgi:glycosyltransferase involved in cell wall biosynthesis
MRSRVSVDRITVCVCTFRRPELLARLLDALSDQRLPPGLTFDVVIIDNDAQRSAEPIASRASARGRLHVLYDIEPQRNISLARNRAIRRAAGTLVAFIDDDECPGEDWLAQLYETYTRSGADGVLGPVLPEFPPSAPAWLKKANVFRRRRLPTGARIGPGDGRTGNVLLKRALFADQELWFDPAYGRSGGEDSDFFQRKTASGAFFVWCDEAVVTEVVPPERWSVSFHVKRLLRAGTTDGEMMRLGKLPSFVARNAAILAACLVLIVPSLLLPRHLWIRVAQKLAYCGGVLSAYCGLPLLRYRD